MSEFLSQEEVDVLLKGVTAEAEDHEDIQKTETGGVRPHNLASQEHIVCGRMPTLEIINERFARLFRSGLFKFIRRTPEISIGPIRALNFGEFVRNLPVPSNFNLIQAKPLRGIGLFIIDPNLLFLMVDNMFGGDGRFHTPIEGREFTQTEQRIVQKLLAIAFEAYGKCWEKVHPLNFEFVRSETNPQFANIAAADEVVIATTFDIELGCNGGAFQVCMPYSMLEPVKDLLYSNMQKEHLATDQRWLQLLSRQVQSANVELVAILGQANVTLEQVLKMHSGDIIPLSVGETITAFVDGVPMMECKSGIFNSQYALKIEKMIPANEQGNCHD